MVDLDEVFRRERPRLVGLAYRILGSRIDAEDLVQEAWLRLRRQDDPHAIDRPEAWLTTVVSRLALDQLRSARHRRETYVGPWLPEPVITGRPGTATGAADPAATAELAESLTFGFLAVLDRLSPMERVVFLLADVFDVPFTEIATSVGRTPAACRQVASRARRKVREARPIATSTRAAGSAPRSPAEAAVLDGLLAATAAGDIAGVVRLLTDDAVLLSDGGATVRAARHPVVGPQRIARFLVGLARKGMTDLRVERVELNSEPGLVLATRSGPFLAIAAHVDAGRIASLHLVRAPDKLAALALDAPLR